MFTSWHLIQLSIFIHLNSVSYIMCFFNISPFYKQFHSHYNQLSLHFLYLYQLLFHRVPLQAFCHFILHHSKTLPNPCQFPCIIKSAHHSAFDQVPNCHSLLPRLLYTLFLQSLFLLYRFAQQKQIAVNYVYILSVSFLNIFH